MGSRSKKKSGSSGYQAVPRTTQAQADRSLSGIMDKQSGLVGSLLGALVDRGEAAMASNPGLMNFMDQVGQAKDKVGDVVTGAFSKPKSLFDELGETLGFAQKEEEPETDVSQPNPYGLTPEQLRQMGQYGSVNGTYNFNGTPYNINDDMRNRFNR